MTRKAISALALMLGVAAACGVPEGTCLSFGGCGGTAPSTGGGPILVTPADGGFKSFGLDARSANIEVPPGAVSQAVEITARTLDAAAPAGALSAIYEFMPDEAAFAVPARMSINRRVLITPSCRAPPPRSPA